MEPIEYGVTRRRTRGAVAANHGSPSSILLAGGCPSVWHRCVNSAQTFDHLVVRLDDGESCDPSFQSPPSKRLHPLRPVAGSPQDPQCGYNQVVSKATSPLSASVGVRDLKNRLSAHLDRVKAGEEITVTEHGRPIARLSPVGAEVDRMTALVNAGIVRAPATTSRRLPARRVRLNAGGSLDDDVADQRR